MEAFENPTHQVLKAPPKLIFLASAGFCSIFSVEDTFAIQDGLDQFFCLTDTGWFRINFCHRNELSTAFICNIDPFSFGDFFCCQAVADTNRCFFDDFISFLPYGIAIPSPQLKFIASRFIIPTLKVFKSVHHTIVRAIGPFSLITPSLSVVKIKQHHVFI